MEEESCVEAKRRRNHGRRIMEEESFWCWYGGGSMEEQSCRRDHLLSQCAATAHAGPMFLRVHARKTTVRRPSWADDSCNSPHIRHLPCPASMSLVVSSEDPNGIRPEIVLIRRVFMRPTRSLGRTRSNSVVCNPSSQSYL